MNNINRAVAFFPGAQMTFVVGEKPTAIFKGGAITKIITWNNGTILRIIGDEGHMDIVHVPFTVLTLNEQPK